MLQDRSISIRINIRTYGVFHNAMVAAIEDEKADVNFHAGVKEAYNNSVNAGPVISGTSKTDHRHSLPD